MSDNNNCETKSSTQCLLENYSYIGWIPNTAGHVYFRNAKVRKNDIDAYNVCPSSLKINPSEYPFIQTKWNELHKVSSTGEVEDCNNSKHVRLILVTSLRDLNDQPPQPEIIRHTRFIVRAISFDKGFLIGDLWMIWDRDMNPVESEFERNLVTNFSNFNNLAIEFRRELAYEDNDLLERSDDDESEVDLRRRLLSFLGGVSEFNHNILDQIDAQSLVGPCRYMITHINFSITNLGFCYLKKISGRNNDQGNESEIQNAYFYLKDLLHTHSHHEGDLDSFCLPHAILKNKKGDRCIELARIMLNDIKSNLVGIKKYRYGIPSFTRNAIGCASYGKTLIHQFRDDKILIVGNPEHDAFIESQPTYIENLIKSIETRQQEESAIGKGVILQYTKEVFAFFVLFIGPLLLFWVNMRKKNEQNDPPPADFISIPIDFLSEFLNISPIASLAVLYLSALLFSVLVSFEYMYRKNVRKTGYLWNNFILKKLCADVLQPKMITPAAVSLNRNNIFINNLTKLTNYKTELKCAIGCWWLRTGVYEHFKYWNREIRKRPTFTYRITRFVFNILQLIIIFLITLTCLYIFSEIARDGNLKQKYFYEHCPEIFCELINYLETYSNDLINRLSSAWNGSSSINKTNRTYSY